MRISRATLGRDAVAGLVLGLQSVPDGLATGLLTGISPLAGLNAYMVGVAAGALVTSSAFMAIQGTGAMAMIIADTPEVTGCGGPRGRALRPGGRHGARDARGGHPEAGPDPAVRLERGHGRVHECGRA